jgi:SAM-dependent methyltransferase
LSNNFLPILNYHDFAWSRFTDQCNSSDEWKLNECHYSKSDLVRYQHVIGNQLDLIKGKRILDIGCSTGVFSLFCLHNGASHVIGIDVRNKELEVAKEVCTFAGYDNFDFRFLNIYELDELKKVCDTVDTILMSGVFYHVNHHVPLIETISSSSAKNLIIESQIWLENPSIPSLFWRLEHTGDTHHGMEKDNQIKTIVVGVPNRNFVEKMIMYGEYKVIYNEQFDYLKDDGLMRHTCVLAGTKNYTNYINPIRKNQK